MILKLEFGTVEKIIRQNEDICQDQLAVILRVMTPIRTARLISHIAQ